MIAYYIAAGLFSALAGFAFSLSLLWFNNQAEVARVTPERLSVEGTGAVGKDPHVATHLRRAQYGESSVRGDRLPEVRMPILPVASTNLSVHPEPVSSPAASSFSRYTPERGKR